MVDQDATYSEKVTSTPSSNAVESASHWVKGFFRKHSSKHDKETPTSNIDTKPAVDVVSFA